VEHVRNVAGVDHVGIGGDFDGAFGFPEGLSDVSMYPNLFAELALRGWSDEALAKLASGNFLRVMRKVEAASGDARAAGMGSAAASSGPPTPARDRSP
jgi:membrane dipeptidase